MAVFNNSTDGNVSGATPEDDFSRPLYLNLTMFIFGLIVSGFNGALLYRLPARRTLFHPVRFVFMINMTLCDTLSGLVMIGLAIANVAGGDGPLVCILQGETCFTYCLTMSAYTSWIVVQFIAVKFPFFYKFNVTKTKVLWVVAACWLYAIGFTTFKLTYVMAATHGAPDAETRYHAFPYLDVCMKIFYLAFNFGCYGYVLTVVTMRCRSQNHQSVESVRNRNANKNNELVFGDAERDVKEKTTERTPFRGQSHANLLQHYEAIITSGLRLLVYVGSSLPLTIFCAYVLATDNANAMNPGKVYGDSRDLGVSLILIWFCRAIFDPLITLLREQPRLVRRHDPDTSSQTRTTSIVHADNNCPEKETSS